MFLFARKPLYTPGVCLQEYNVEHSVITKTVLQLLIFVDRHRLSQQGVRETHYVGIPYVAWDERAKMIFIR